MDSRKKYLFKNVGLLTISNFSSKILVFFLVPLYTNILSTSEYGTYDIVYSTIQLLFPIVTLNISDAVMRYLFDCKYEKNKIVSIGFRIFVIGSLPVALFMLCCWKWGWIKIIRGNELVILLLFISFSLYQFMTQMAKGMERVMDMGVAGVLSTVMLLGGNICFLVVIDTGLAGFYYASLLSQLIPTLYLVIRIKLWKHLSENLKEHQITTDMLAYCLPLLTTALGWWINDAADKYTVIFFCGTSDNGLLSVAYKIPSIMNSVATIFISAWQISAIKEYGNANYRDFYRDTFVLFGSVGSVICSMVIIFTKFIASFMFAKDFYSAWQFVPILLVSSFFSSTAGFLGPILSAKKDSKSMAKSAILGAAANILLNIVFVWTIGVQGATIATMISSFIIYILRKRASGCEISGKNYKLYISWGLLIIQSIVMIYFTLLWFEIAVLSIIFALNSKELCVLFKKSIRNKQSDQLQKQH